MPPRRLVSCVSNISAIRSTLFFIFPLAFSILSSYSMACKLRPAAPAILKITKEQLYENFTYNSHSARNYASCIM